MGDYTGGVTSALDSRSRRGVEDAQAKALLQQIMQAQAVFQQQQETQKRQQQAKAMLGDLLPQLAAMGGGAGGGPQPQPPMPGQPSVPMMPPGMPSMPPQSGPAAGPMPGMPPGGAPPAPMPSMPPPPAQGQGAPMAKAGGPGAPMPGAGAPPAGAAPPMPPQPWQSLPKPPEAAPAGPGGLPPPPEDAVMPKQLISVSDLSKLLAAKGIKGTQAMDMIEQWKPYMDSQNKAELDAMKVQNTAQAAALRAYTAVVREAETRRHHGALEGEAEARLKQGQQRININVNKGEAAGENDLSKDPETRRFMAEQYWAGDRTVMQNLGRGAQGSKNIVALRKEIVAVGKDQGKTPKDLAAAVAEFEGMKSGERTLGTRTANVEMAVTEAQNMAQIVLDSSKAFSRSQFMPVNKALKAFNDNTGSTESRQFGAAINSFINAYARAISPSGTPTVHDKEHAREMLSTADSHEQVEAVMKTLRQEMDAARKSPGQVKSSMRQGFTDKGGEDDYVEMRTTKDGRTLGKKADGTVEVVR